MERFAMQDLVQSTGGRLRDVELADARFSRISTDSREIEPGDIFWALQGEHHHGHDFVSQAQDKQAQLSVVATSQADAVAGPVLIVDDTLAALGQFAKWHRNQLDPLVIGVTGSVGKTTTRELIFAALSGPFSGIRSRKNFNNLIGLPLSLLDLEPSHEFAVMEMGASAQGDIEQLCHIALPEIGVITAIGPAHLQSFGSLDQIIKTKGELLEQLPSTGFAVMPGDEDVLRNMSGRAGCPVIFVGQHEHNPIRATNIQADPDRLRFHCQGHPFILRINGRHLIPNVLCAIAIGLELGIPIERLAEGLSQFVPAAGRGKRVQIGSWTIVDDTYNASPLSVAASCRMLRELPLTAQGQRMLILGDMRELGETAVREHERIGKLAAELQIDRLLVCGEFANDLARGARQNGMQSHQIAAAPDLETLLAVLDCWLEPDDLLLIKGSRSTRMERVLDWLKIRAESLEPQPATSDV
jgi:UDP-N-acetylmuramoyl-tripeptide--D-alanyl-D-alanine ligase